MGDENRYPGLAVAAIASIGAGAIHAAAIGIHAEHPQLARLFVAVTVAQLAVGLVALLRPLRVGAGAVAAVNAAAVGAWLVTRLTGVSFVDGLEVRESAQFADTTCAALGAIAAGCGGAAALVGRRAVGRIRLTVPALAVAALAVPAMVSGGTHTHAHAEAEADGHSHAATEGAAAAAPGDTTAHAHATDTTVPVDAGAAPWPRPWDPSKPIDVSGVKGVTPEQESRATTLIEGSLKDLPKYADTAAAEAAGYQSIGDAATGSEHFINAALVQDDVMLDPTQPESLVYTVNGDTRTLAGAMYIVSARPLDDLTLTDFAGPLMQWHNHSNLCFGLGDNGKPKVLGITQADGTCAKGVNAGGQFPMIHVWITPHPCGVFAALEGVGAGAAAVPDDQRVDLCNHGHDAASPAAAVSSHPYDPSKPIDLSGVEGVTPEQQAAAENLVAVNVVRLPQWSDVKAAEAAGFHSIGDAGTGFEHFINWSWIEDDVTLDPDHPESLVYKPLADGTKQLVSAMYMLPSSVKLADVPNIGGALMQWHIHNDLCFTDDPVAPQVRGLTDARGACPAPLVHFRPSPMIHVWIVPHKCGPFASLEGVGAGQIADGETRLCDHVHGSGF